MDFAIVQPGGYTSLKIMEGFVHEFY